MALDPNNDVSKAVTQPPADERFQKILDKALYAGGSPEAQNLRNFLNGTWLGEPLHVVLTDLPIGAWTAAMCFDLLELLVDRHEFALAADASIGVGLAGAAGAAITGLTDWSDVDPPARRLGLLDEKRLEMVARNRSIKAKDGELPAKLLIAFVRKADEGTIGKLIVEAIILLSARSQSDGGKVLRTAAQEYGVDTDAVAIKVKQEFAAKEKARKASKTEPKPAAKARRAA